MFKGGQILRLLPEVSLGVRQWHWSHWEYFLIGSHCVWDFPWRYPLTLNELCSQVPLVPVFVFGRVSLGQGIPFYFSPDNASYVGPDSSSSSIFFRVSEFLNKDGGLQMACGSGVSPSWNGSLGQEMVGVGNDTSNTGPAARLARFCHLILFKH